MKLHAHLVVTCPACGADITCPLSVGDTRPSGLDTLDVQLVLDTADLDAHIATHRTDTP